MDPIRTIEGLAALRDRKRRVLAVFPHPDDEAYGTAGALARAGLDPDAAAVLFCLTRGEASAMGAERGMTPEQVGDLREGRLVRVAEALELDGLLVGSFPDGRLARVPVCDVAEEISAAIEAFEPRVVVGHEPRGVNAHADHVASHWAIRRALEDRPGVRFAMVSYPPEAVELVKPRLLLATPDEEMDAILTLSEEEARRKEISLRIHDALVTLDPELTDRMLWRPPLEHYDFLGEDLERPVADLFAGLDGVD